MDVNEKLEKQGMVANNRSSLDLNDNHDNCGNDFNLVNKKNQNDAIDEIEGARLSEETEKENISIDEVSSNSDGDSSVLGAQTPEEHRKLPKPVKQLSATSLNRTSQQNHAGQKKGRAKEKTPKNNVKNITSKFNQYNKAKPTVPD